MPTTLLAAIEAQRAAGIMFVAAAGNSGSLGCSSVSDSPAIYDAAYTVGAYNSLTGALTSFSSRGPVTADGSGRMKPDVTAPGASVRSAALGGGYVSYNGTSMASPHVAGAVALLWSAFPSLRHRITETENVLDLSAVHVSSSLCDAGAIPNNAYGWGRIDVMAAVTLGPVGVGQNPPDGPASEAVFLAPAFPNPARRSTLLRFRLAQAGAFDLAIFATSGQRVRTLESGTVAAGERTVRWDGLGARGESLPPAVYFVRLLSRGMGTSQKVIWLGR